MSDITPDTKEPKMTDETGAVSRPTFPWETRHPWKRLLWEVYFWTGDKIQDDERGRYCSCRWEDDTLHPTSVCEYHRLYATGDPRIHPQTGGS